MTFPSVFSQLQLRFALCCDFSSVASGFPLFTDDPFSNLSGSYPL